MNSIRKTNDSEDINELLARYANDATQFIASSSALKQMVADGLKLDERIPESKEDYINRIFDERKKVAQEVIDKLPVKPNIDRKSVV